MAIDTAEKRKSVAGIPFLIPSVTSSAAKDKEWRREAAWNYPFELAFVEPAPVIALGDVPTISYRSSVPAQGESVDTDQTLGDILWDDNSTILWDDLTVIEWSETRSILPDVNFSYNTPRTSYTGEAE